MGAKVRLKKRNREIRWKRLPCDKFCFQHDVFKLVYRISALNQLDEHFHRYTAHFEGRLANAGETRPEEVEYIRIGKPRDCRMGVSRSQFVVCTKATHTQPVARYKN